MRGEAFCELDQLWIAAARRIRPFGRRDQHPHHRLADLAKRNASRGPHDESHAGKRQQRDAEIERTQGRQQKTATLRLRSHFGNRGTNQRPQWPESGEQHDSDEQQHAAQVDTAGIALKTHAYGPDMVQGHGLEMIRTAVDQARLKEGKV